MSKKRRFNFFFAHYLLAKSKTQHLCTNVGGPIGIFSGLVHELHELDFFMVITFLDIVHI